MTRTLALLTLLTAAASVGCGGAAGQAKLPDKPLPAVTKGTPPPAAGSHAMTPVKAQPPRQ